VIERGRRPTGSELEISRARVAGGSEFWRNEERGRHSGAEKIRRCAGRTAVMRLFAERRERVSGDGPGPGQERGGTRGGGNNGKIPKAKVAGSQIISGRESRNLRGFVGGDESGCGTNSRGGGLAVFQRMLFSREPHASTGLGGSAEFMERRNNYRVVNIILWDKNYQNQICAVEEFANSVIRH
jgi:hypothetical protein